MSSHAASHSRAGEKSRVFARSFAFCRPALTRLPSTCMPRYTWQLYALYWPANHGEVPRFTQGPAFARRALPSVSLPPLALSPLFSTSQHPLYLSSSLSQLPMSLTAPSCPPSPSPFPAVGLPFPRPQVVPVVVSYALHLSFTPSSLPCLPVYQPASFQPPPPTPRPPAGLLPLRESSASMPVLKINYPHFCCLPLPKRDIVDAQMRPFALFVSVWPFRLSKPLT